MSKNKKGGNTIRVEMDESYTASLLRPAILSAELSRLLSTSCTAADSLNNSGGGGEADRIIEVKSTVENVDGLCIRTADEGEGDIDDQLWATGHRTMAERSSESCEKLCAALP